LSTKGDNVKAEGGRSLNEKRLPKRHYSITSCYVQKKKQKTKTHNSRRWQLLLNA
jgi:hypothetical protein